MANYKRNQIEEAISRVFAPNFERPGAELRPRIKRLLELDRAFGRKSYSQDEEEANFAFFSDEAPGTGSEIWFSDYEAFALLSGLRMMEHGWSQGFTVSVMRRLRPDLEKQHGFILKQNPDELFDCELIQANARPGDIAVDNTAPVFIVLISKTRRPSGEAATRPECAVCRGMQEVGGFIKEQGAQGWTLFEVATVAHTLSNELTKTKPKRRGRE